eukprot:6454901-Amphidinium_carterae.3
MVDHHLQALHGAAPLSSPQHVAECGSLETSAKPGSIDASMWTTVGTSHADAPLSKRQGCHSWSPAAVLPHTVCFMHR